MPTVAFSSTPHLDNLKNQARTLQRRVRDGDADARALLAEFHPRYADHGAGLADFQLTDAQLVVARQYGFPSWPRLREYVQTVQRYARNPQDQPVGAAVHSRDEAIAEFLRLACLNYGTNEPARLQQARDMLAADPTLAGATVHTAAAVGDLAATQRILAADPTLANAVGGPYDWEPLLYAAYSRLDLTDPAHSTLAVARYLLDHGADPNAGYLWDGTYVFTALTGAFGGGERGEPAHQHALPLARLLLERGADANDGQTLYNRGLGGSGEDTTDHLELLFEFGLGAGDGGPWAARLAPLTQSPQRLVDEELHTAALRGLPRRAALLLARGADVGSRGGHPVFGGRTAYETAVANGNVEVAELLAAAGAGTDLTPAEALVAAAARGDATAADQLVAANPGVVAAAAAGGQAALVTAAEKGREDAVRLLVRLGFELNPAGTRTPLHAAALHGQLGTARLLIGLGAAPDSRDPDFDATPLGWAEHAEQAAVADYLRGVTDQP